MPRINRLCKYAHNPWGRNLWPGTLSNSNECYKEATFICDLCGIEGCGEVCHTLEEACGETLCTACHETYLTQRAVYLPILEKFKKRLIFKSLQKTRKLTEALRNCST